MKLKAKIENICEQVRTMEYISPLSPKTLNKLKTEIKEIISSSKEKELILQVGKEQTKTLLANLINTFGSMRASIKEESGKRSFSSAKKTAMGAMLKIIAAHAAAEPKPIIAADSSLSVRKQKTMSLDDLREMREELENKNELEPEGKSNILTQLDKSVDESWNRIFKISQKYKKKAPTSIKEGHYKLAAMPLVVKIDPFIMESDWSRMGIKSEPLYPGSFLREQMVLFVNPKDWQAGGNDYLNKILKSIHAVGGPKYMVINFEEPFKMKGSKCDCFWLLTPDQYGKTRGFGVEWIGFAFQEPEKKTFGKGNHTIIDMYKADLEKETKEARSKLENLNSKLDRAIKEYENIDIKVNEIKRAIDDVNNKLKSTPNDKSALSNRRALLKEQAKLEKQVDKIQTTYSEAAANQSKAQKEFDKIENKVKKKWLDISRSQRK